MTTPIPAHDPKHAYFCAVPWCPQYVRNHNLPAELPEPQAPEWITEHNDEGDYLVCLCGNVPGSSGFYTALADGEFVPPTPSSAWDGDLITCAECGRIISPMAGWQVVGRAREGFAERWIAAEADAWREGAAR
jgi:hypothetical protein